MIKIGEDLTTIHLTRGDSTNEEYNNLSFKAPYINALTGDEEDYIFTPNDKICFTVFEKKGYTKSEILKKEYTLTDLGYVENTTTPELRLTAEDTKKFPLTNKPVTYWYDLVLNETNTIIGYDEDGAKKIIVYPEANEELR